MLTREVEGSPFVTTAPVDLAGECPGVTKCNPGQLILDRSNLSNRSSSFSKVLELPLIELEEGVEVVREIRIEEMPHPSSSSLTSSSSLSVSPGLRNLRHSQRPSGGVRESVRRVLGPGQIQKRVRLPLMVRINLRDLFSKRSGRPGPNLFKDGAREGRSIPSSAGQFVEEFSHFCDCPRCFDLCFLFLESEVETLCSQFLRTEDILRDSHPNLAGQIGSFRVWLDWNRFLPALKAFLLAVGTFSDHLSRCEF